MKAWVELYGAHCQARSVDPNWTTEVRNRLGALAEAGHCNPTIRQRFTNLRDRGSEEWYIRPIDQTSDEPLYGVAGLAHARIAIRGLVQGRTHLRMLTVSVEGERPDGSPWILAVHVPDDATPPDHDRQGLGACGHAAYHCHVGPDYTSPPLVRVPFPAVGPVEVVDWVLSQIMPTARFEPAPWADVQATR